MVVVKKDGPPFANRIIRESPKPETGFMIGGLRPPNPAFLSKKELLAVMRRSRIETSASLEKPPVLVNQRGFEWGGYSIRFK